ncbi:predicted protein [Naegleria gruberi]|uniref:Predicted protein n=1 Tax=Naegleria gruberi TaxID=5762 RepID=D2V8E2_NAEGR|nr:uncharacterized protein NAEGRDRAFT_65126 [Naegleria gruberi]EFC47163.1 predicted protein [Naegleria gruberi]|eukprot:XP_002679907.1 predicted protein [Naegleria gruberi strain NEG-M]
MMKETLTSCMGWIVCNEDGEETRFMKPFRRRQSNSATTTLTHQHHHQQQQQQNRQKLMEYYILLEQFHPDFVYENVFKWFCHDEVMNCLSHVCRYFRQICCCYLPIHIKYDSHLDENILHVDVACKRNANHAVLNLSEDVEGSESVDQVHDENFSVYVVGSGNVLVEKIKSSLPFKKVVKFSIIGNPKFYQIPTIESFKHLRSLAFNVHYYSNVSEMSKILEHFLENIENQQQFTKMKHLQIENTFNLNENTSLNLPNIIHMMKKRKGIPIPTITCLIPIRMHVLLKYFRVENLIVGSIFSIKWKKVHDDVCLNLFKCQLTSYNLHKFEKLVNHEKFKVKQLEIQGNASVLPFLSRIIEQVNQKMIKTVIFHQSVDGVSLFKLLNSQTTLQQTEIVIKDPICIKFSEFESCWFNSRIFSISVSIENESELSEFIEILKRLPKMELLCVVCENEKIFTIAKYEFTNSNKLQLSNILFYRRTNSLESDNIIGASKFNFDRLQKINKRKNESQFLKDNCTLLDLKFKKCKPYFPYLKILP